MSFLLISNTILLESQLMCNTAEKIQQFLLKTVAEMQLFGRPQATGKDMEEVTVSLASASGTSMLMQLFSHTRAALVGCDQTKKIDVFVMLDQVL